MQSIALAANILDTSEYEVLRLAYAEWHGHVASQRVIEQTFSRYLREGKAPYWARHYADKVIREFDAGQAAGAWVLLMLFPPKPRKPTAGMNPGDQLLA